MCRLHDHKSHWSMAPVSDCAIRSLLDNYQFLFVLRPYWRDQPAAGSELVDE